MSHEVGSELTCTASLSPGWYISSGSHQYSPCDRWYYGAKGDTHKMIQAVSTRP